MPRHGANGASRPASPAAGVGLSRPGSVDLEPEPEAAYRAGGRAGGGGAGVANYVDLDHEEDLTASMRPYAHMVQDACDLIQAQFGFQRDNVRNQRENVLMLLGNTLSGLPTQDQEVSGDSWTRRTGGDIDDRDQEEYSDDQVTDAVVLLHKLQLNSYKKWAKKMVNVPREDALSPSPESTAKKVHEIVLWWCVWGEAGNMRFMPEFISWVYYTFVRELTVPMNGQHQASWERRNYLDQVIKPMYNYLKSEMHKKNVAGVLAEHIYKKNYDDINEFFWRPECLEEEFSLHSDAERMDHATGGKYHDSVVKAGAWNVEPLLKGLRQQPKTFLERRGMAHAFKANIRVFAFYFVLFQAIVTIAHDVPFQQDVLPLCPPQLQLSAQTPSEILNDMDRTSGPTCDLTTAMCHYTNKYGTPVTYSCLDQLGSTQEQRKAATKRYMDLSNEVMSILYDLIPFYSGPVDNRTGLALARSEQLRTFDSIWRGDGLPLISEDGVPYCNHMPEDNPDKYYLFGDTCFKSRNDCDPQDENGENCESTGERSIGNYEPKHEFLKIYGSRLFTCGFNETSIMEQANNSICCQLKLSPANTGASNTTEVWARVADKRGCNWGMVDMFVPWRDNYEYYSAVRLQLLLTVVTLTFFRLLGEVLEFWAQRGILMSQGISAGLILRTSLYSILFLLLVGTYWWCEMGQGTCGAVSDISDSVPFFSEGTAFQVLALLALTPEVCGGLMQSFFRDSNFFRRPSYIKVMGKFATDTRTFATYTVFWLFIIFGKCYFSYYYEIRSQVRNSATTWKAMATPFASEELMQEHGSWWDQLLFNSIRSAEGNIWVAWFALFVTWVPTLLVFLMDTQIFFSLAQMFAGTAVGLFLRVGQINSWEDFQFRYAKMVSKFEKHLNASERDADGNCIGPLANAYKSRSGPGTHDDSSPDARRSAYFVGGRDAMATGRAMLARSFSGMPSRTAAMRHTQDGHSVPSLRESLLGSHSSIQNRGKETTLQTASFRVNFVETWNKFMEKLRYDDLISDNEMSLFKCLKLTGFDDIKLEPMLPVLLTLQGIEKVLDELDATDHEYNRFVFQSIHDVDKVEVRGGTKSRWEEKMSKRYEEQEQKMKAHAAEWSKMAIQKIDELQRRKQYSGPREAIRQARHLTFYLINKTLGVERHRDAILEVSSWLPTIGGHDEVDEADGPISFEKFFNPFLANLLKRQKAGGPKGTRRNLKSAVLNLAKLMADEVCYSAPGLSKQLGQTFDRCHVRGGYQGDKTVKKMRNALKKVLDIVTELCEDPVERSNRDGAIITAIKNTLDKPDGFFKDDQYAEAQLRQLARSDTSTNAIDAATFLKHLLLTMQFEAVPQVDEARRRILTFASSLHMDMPAPIHVKNMRSLTTLTPFYDEDVLYGKQQICGSSGGTPSWCFYLKAMHPHEWANMFERLGLEGVNSDPPTIPDRVWADPLMEMEVRLWASLRGQTLARVIHGVMQYDEALQLFARHEYENEVLPQPDGGSQRRGDITTNSSSHPRDRIAPGAVWRSESLPQRHAHQKYGYVISCQIYGAYTREPKGTARHAKVQQIKDLLRLFPHLRIAYTDESPDKKHHFSCLMRWDAPKNDTVEIYRVELPGHMLVGEGKPENQNHAIIFTRGEMIQTLDMNQDGYFEEALKMRNLLREFDNDRVAIIGFPEHQFTEALSATAEFAALTEFTFATLIQRTLGDPFDVRMHYGHPDVFDRVFHVTRGGISKANKVLCVSEDIFGAFNSVLKGGRVIYREYIKAGKGKDLGFEQVYLFESKISSGNGEQALSRDFSRLTEQFDLPRLLSFFHSSNGFYWSNMLVIWSTSWFVYTQIMISVIIPDEQGSLLADLTKAVTFSVQLGIILTVPLVAELVLEKGVAAASYQMLRVIFTGGPLFFMFHIRTKSYFYDITITLGGAKYMPTGRGFVLGHTNFVKLFRMFCNSHFNYGFTLLLNLLVYRQFIVDPSQYLAVSWATWLFALDLLYAPFLFNCLAFDRAEVEKDMESWRKFIRRNDKVDPNKSWRAHWEDNNSIYNNLSGTQRANLICRNLFWLILALAIILENLGSSVEHLWVVPAIVLAGIMMMLCVTRNAVSFMGLGCFQQGLKSRRVRRIMVLISNCVIAVAVYVLFQKYSHPVDLLFEYFAAAGYIFAFVVNTLFYLGYRSEFIYAAYWMWDLVLGYLLLAPFYILSYLGACSDAHMRLLYNMTFVVGLKMQTLMEKSNISRRLADLEQGVKQSNEKISLQTSKIEEHENMRRSVGGDRSSVASEDLFEQAAGAPAAPSRTQSGGMFRMADDVQFHQNSVFSPVADPDKSGPSTDPKVLAGYQGANRVNQWGELAGTNERWERQRRKSRPKRGGGATREV